jgi:ligand-binding sensor domain-containing protein
MNSRCLRILPAALLGAALLPGCSDEPSTASPVPPGGQPPAVAMPPAARHGVLDSFEVGADVYVRALAVDHARNSLWVGTSAGVHEVDLGDYAVKQTFTRDDGLANEYVFAIGIDHAGRKWFGTNAGGVSRYRDGEWKTFFPMHGLADYWVYSFASQRDGTLWIGTWAGANRANPDEGTFETFVRELVNEWVYGIAVDSADRVWFGTEGGISRFDGTEWVSWTHDDGLGAPNEHGLLPSTNTGLGTRSRHDLGVMRGGAPTYNPNYVFAVHIDPDDVLWTGTWGGGVSRFDGSDWVSYTRRDGLPGNIVYSIVQDAEGVIWVGTDNGVAKYENDGWQPVGVEEGFVGMHVYALAVSPDGEIWAGTRGAVVRIGRAGKGE